MARWKIPYPRSSRAWLDYYVAQWEQQFKDCADKRNRDARFRLTCIATATRVKSILPDVSVRDWNCSEAAAIRKVIETAARVLVDLVGERTPADVLAMDLAIANRIGLLDISKMRA